MKTYMVWIKFRMIDAEGTPKFDQSNELIEQLREFVDGAVLQFAAKPNIAVKPASIDVELE